MFARVEPQFDVAFQISWLPTDVLPEIASWSVTLDNSFALATGEVVLSDSAGAPVVSVSQSVEVWQFGEHSLRFQVHRQDGSAVSFIDHVDVLIEVAYAIDAWVQVGPNGNITVGPGENSSIVFSAA